jgi:hypothetical protein
MWKWPVIICMYIHGTWWSYFVKTKHDVAQNGNSHQWNWKNAMDNPEREVFTFRRQSPSMLAVPLLNSRFSSSCSTTMSRQCEPPNPVTLPLDSPLEYNNLFVTEASSNNSALAVSLFALERSRCFLLEYLNPDPLLFFLVSVDGKTPLPHSSALKESLSLKRWYWWDAHHERPLIYSWDLWRWYPQNSWEFWWA